MSRVFDKKPGIGVLIGAMPEMDEDAEESHARAHEHSSGFKLAIHELLHAIDKRDPEKFADALCAAIDLRFAEMESEEGDEAMDDAEDELGSED